MTRERAEQYRRLARECLAISRTVSREEARAELVLMAESWLRLADEQDQEESNIEELLTPRHPVEDQPVAQQQQQIQPKDDDK